MPGLDPGFQESPAMELDRPFSRIASNALTGNGIKPGDDEGAGRRHQTSAAAIIAVVAKKPTDQMAERRYMIPLA